VPVVGGGSCGPPEGADERDESCRLRRGRIGSAAVGARSRVEVRGVATRLVLGGTTASAQEEGEGQKN